jgi:RNA polymerase sigma-70 factor (ECF subfamily)
MAMSDKELVKRCQADPAAFEELMRRYKRAIFAYAVASTGSRQDAEEVTQDVFVKVYRAAHRFDSQYAFTTWLYKIASNTCKNKLRGRRRRAVSLDSEDSPVVAVSAEAGPLEAYKRSIEIAEVRDAINGLPPRYREVLYLRYVEGLSYKDIAETLGLSLGNVEARIFRGKGKVREKLLKGHGSG